MILSHLDMERRYEIILTDQPWKQTKWVREIVGPSKIAIPV